MSALRRLGRVVERPLEAVCIALMAGLAVVVLLAVISRKAGASLVRLGELAAIMLAWLTIEAPRRRPRVAGRRS